MKRTNSLLLLRDEGGWVEMKGEGGGGGGGGGGGEKGREWVVEWRVR